MSALPRGDAASLALALDLLRQVASNGAPGAAPTDAQASTVAQLEALYAEREQLEQQLGTSDPSRLVAVVRDLESQRSAATQSTHALGEHLGNGDIVEFVMRTEATVASLTEQLGTLYAGGEGGGDEPATNFEEQLGALYADREQLAHAFGTADAEDLARVVLEREKGFVEQLHALYGERDELSRELGPDEPLQGGLRGSTAHRGGVHLRPEHPLPLSLPPGAARAAECLERLSAR